jgi:hypothetical protein
MEDATELLHSLLVEAATAHGIYEAKELGGVYDTEWPQYYAEHMAAALAEKGYTLAPV